MKETYEKMETIRGTRYAVKLEKRVAGMPGFSPEYRDRDVGEVVFKFPHGEGKTYLQLEENPPILDQKDIEQLLDIFNRKFDENNWN